jgi:hypothetical protein
MLLDIAKLRRLLRVELYIMARAVLPFKYREFRLLEILFALRVLVRPCKYRDL